jgi:steroid 5-alpha reductase family enzyme
MSAHPPKHSRAASFGYIVLAYVVAIAAAYGTVLYFPLESPLYTAFLADFVATCAVFAFSVAFSNSSFYDAYWSVIPPLIGVYFWTHAAPDAELTRQALCLGLCTLWAVRLTYNWAVGWTGLHHEDWRYVDIKAKTGALYWPASFAGIHMFPTVEVFFACLPMWPALTSNTPLSWIDGVATVVTLGAIVIETVADEQLRAFGKTKKPGELIQTGLWRYSRHPNYFGELTFWWGLFLFGYAASPADWSWTIIGTACITVMFFFISVPMMEKRQLEKKPHFAKVIASTSMIIPWFHRGSAASTSPSE